MMSGGGGIFEKKPKSFKKMLQKKCSQPMRTPTVERVEKKELEKEIKEVPATKGG
jgi:hypothetical protein